MIRAYYVELLAIEHNREDAESYAHTIVFCEEEKWHNVFMKYFNCFNMDWENVNTPIFFTVDVCDLEEAEIDYSDADFMQSADEIDENNPFLLDSEKCSYAWSIVNGYKYGQRSQLRSDFAILDYLATTNFIFE